MFYQLYSKVDYTEKDYKILYKEGDDFRKDLLIFQSLELIKKVRFIFSKIL